MYVGCLSAGGVINTYLFFSLIYMVGPYLRQYCDCENNLSIEFDKLTYFQAL
jgi:hypothetical protein